METSAVFESIPLRPSVAIFAWVKINGTQARRCLETTSVELAKSELAGLARNEFVVADDRRRWKMLLGEALELIPANSYATRHIQTRD